MRVLMLTTSLLLVACPPAAISTCVPGRQERCDCAAGAGVQSCEPNGTFGPCECTPASGGGGGNGAGGVVAAGGGSPTGGGGGGSARVDELVSGTRLRATAWVGADGARKGGSLFWDSQLQTYCAVYPPVASLGFPISSCVPYPLAIFSVGPTRFEGAMCTGASLIVVEVSTPGSVPLAGAQPLVTSFGLSSVDGGLILNRLAELQRGATISSRLPDGGCQAETYAGSDGGSLSYQAFRTVGTVDSSELVRGTTVTD